MNIVQIVEKIILQNNGIIITENYEDYYLINPEDDLATPLGLPSALNPVIQDDNSLKNTFLAISHKANYTWKLIEGSLHKRLTFLRGKIFKIISNFKETDTELGYSFWYTVYKSLSVNNFIVVLKYRSCASYWKYTWVKAILI